MVKKPRQEYKYASKKVWDHNRHIGLAVLMQRQCDAIWQSSTASPTAQRIANEMYRLAGELELNLRNERIDK